MADTSVEAMARSPFDDLADTAARDLGHTAALVPLATKGGASPSGSPTSPTTPAAERTPCFARPQKLDRDMALAWRAAGAARRVLALARLHPELCPEGWPSVESGQSFYLQRQKHELLRVADDAVDSMIIRPSVLTNPALMEELSLVLFVAARRDARFDYNDEDAQAMARSAQAFTGSSIADAAPEVVHEDQVGLWALESAIMEHLVTNPSVHLYVVVPLPGDERNYANLVLARPLKSAEAPIAVMDGCPAHEATVATTAPRAYRWVTIHAGSCRQLDFALPPSSAATVPADGSAVEKATAIESMLANDADGALPLPRGTLTFTRSKCIDYGRKMPPPLPEPCAPWRRKGVLPRFDTFPMFQPRPVDARNPKPQSLRTLALGYEAYSALLAAESAPSTSDNSKRVVHGADVDLAAPLPVPRSAQMGARSAAGQPIRFTSCMGHNQQPFYRDTVMPYLAAATGLTFEWVDPEPIWLKGSWRCIDGLVNEDPIVDVVVTCGVEFARHYFSPLDAPVPEAKSAIAIAATVTDYSALPAIGFTPRMRPAFERAVAMNLGLQAGEDPGFEHVDYAAATYTSTLLCRRDLTPDADAPPPKLEDFRGKRFAVNEGGSWSGCFLLRLVLHGRGIPSTAAADGRWGELSQYFGDVVDSGSHKQSLAALLEGRADCALIDASVLANALHGPDRERILATLRAVDVPELATALWPAPPVVASRVRLSPWERAALQRALGDMHNSPVAEEPGVALTRRAAVRRFAPVGAGPYRVMAATVRALDQAAAEAEAKAAAEAAAKAR